MGWWILAGVWWWMMVMAWGWGLTRLITPRAWRGWEPALVPMAGLGLQTAVVWAGAWLNLPGTLAYGGAVQAVPAGLAIWAWRRHGGGMAAWRATWTWHGAAGLTLGAGLVALGAGGGGPTAMSLGSCDLADYAAGARLFLEFSRTDRMGFLGLTEVVAVEGTGDFFGYFLRLNHFAPSALIALQAAISGWAPWELVSVAGVVFLAVGVPIVGAVARVGFGLRGAWSGWVALVYGLNPLTWYALGHGALSQLMVAPTIAVITLLGWQAARARGGWRETGGWGWGVVAWGLLWAAYNFIVLVAWIPAAGAAAGLAWRRRRGRWLGAWAVGLAAPAVAAGLFFAGRVEGLAARLRLLEAHDFGWPVPGLTPEAWVGWVGAVDLYAMGGGMRWVLAGLVLAGGVVSLRRWWWGRERGWLVAAWVGPAVAGYAYFWARGEWAGTNGSYDAYKWLSVFFPGVLAAALSVGAAAGRRWVAMLVVAGVTAGVGQSVARFGAAWAEAPLRVTRELARVQELENDERVASLNVLPERMWERLWANQFLLRKPQFFATHTYEARRNTALRGEWDLRDGWAAVEGEGARRAGGLVAVRRGSSADVRVETVGDWYAVERDPRAGEVWRWAGAAPRLVLHNATGEARRFRLELEVRALKPRTVQLVGAGAADVGEGRATVGLGAIWLPEGRSEWELEVGEIATPEADGRELSVAVYAVRMIGVTK